MTAQKGKAAIAIIKQDSFYSCKEEKTKLNWFCYEIAMAFYDHIQDALERELEKNKINSEALAGFSIFLSKKMKSVILQKIAGEIEKAYLSHEWIEEYFPSIDDELVNKVLDAMAKAWDEQLGFCEVCPTRCISEKDAQCTMFHAGYLRNMQHKNLEVP